MSTNNELPPTKKGIFAYSRPWALCSERFWSPARCVRANIPQWSVTSKKIHCHVRGCYGECYGSIPQNNECLQGFLRCYGSPPMYIPPIVLPITNPRKPGKTRGTVAVRMSGVLSGFPGYSGVLWGFLGFPRVASKHNQRKRNDILKKRNGRAGCLSPPTNANRAFPDTLRHKNQLQ
jgi:hypothetical protein